MNEFLDKLLNTLFSYNSPVVYVLFVALMFLNCLQDKFASQKLLGSNGLLLCFNMIVYFSLLHIVFKLSVKQKSNVLAENLQTVALEKNVNVTINPPKVQGRFVHPDKLENIYFGAMSAFCLIFLIYVVYFYKHFQTIKPKQQNQIQLGMFLILLTVYSEIFLVFHVFNNQLVSICELFLKSSTTPEFDFKEKNLKDKSL